MDVLGWIWWLVANILGVAWGLVWFLLGGWVSTLAQIGVVALVIFGYKYGWRQAPQEIITRATKLGRFVWGWVRARDMITTGQRVEVREVYRTVKVKEAGDVNISTLLSLLTLGGIGLLAVL